MQAERGSGFDWRDAAAYVPLLGADRSLFAWEWLRRDPRYVAAARGSSPVCGRAAAFGLVEFEAPQRSVPDARPLWSAHVHPYVLPVDRGRHSGREDSFDLGRFARIGTIAANEVGEHLLLTDGLRAIRLDAPPGTFCGGPVSLRYMLEGIGAAERPLLTLRRLLALCRSGGFSRSLHRRETRARRWILMLRACDALASGADQREIAEELFSRTAGEPLWRSREPSVRSRAQRLVRSVRDFSAGGYHMLLG